MSADSLYDNIRSFLRLTPRVVSKFGDIVNVKEKFTIRFTGSNSAYAANLVGKPRIVFLNTRVYVEGTIYAAPVGGDGWHNLPDSALFPGESSFVDVEFTALRNMGGFLDLFLSERVARAWIRADLDQDRFFQIWNVTNFYQEIEPT